MVKDAPTEMKELRNIRISPPVAALNPLRDGDILLLSYPKCGTNWIMSIVLLLMNEGENLKQRATWIIESDEAAAAKAKGKGSTPKEAIKEAIKEPSGGYPNEQSNAPKLEQKNGNGGYVQANGNMNGGNVNTEKKEGKGSSKKSIRRSEASKMWEVMGPTEYAALEGRRSIETHLRPDLLAPEGAKSFPKGVKTIVVQRNAKDACTSAYYWFDEALEYESFSKFSREFIQSTIGESEIPVFDKGQPGNYVDWHASWWQAKQEWMGDNLLWLHYEDMKQDLHTAVRAIAEHCGLNSSDEVVNKVCERCGAKAVKECDSMKAFAKHIRNGGTGEWRDHFTVADDDFWNETKKRRIEALADPGMYPVDRET